MPTEPNRPIMRPGPPVHASVVVPGNPDLLARQALAETEQQAPSFVPSIQNNPVASPQPTVPAPQAVPVSEAPKPEEATPKTEDLTPAERWQKALAAAGITEQEAYSILDSVIQKGYWEKEYRLWNGRVKCVFRTRDAHHLLRAQKALEALDDRSQYSISQTLFRANVAASLATYQGSLLPHTDLAKASVAEIEDAYTRRYEFVGKLPAPVFEQMTVALAHFDAIVAAATAEGAAQGF